MLYNHLKEEVLILNLIIKESKKENHKSFKKWFKNSRFFTFDSRNGDNKELHNWKYKYHSNFMPKGLRLLFLL